MENLTGKYLINGPNNCMRLTDGDKILYIFGDFHADINQQKECEVDDNYDSIDIDKLIYKFIKMEKNREIDIFLEEYKFYSGSLYQNTYRQRYIDQVSKFVKSNINIENNKIITNKKYSNFRFHYFDIRDIFNNFFFYYAYNILNPSYSIPEIKKMIDETLELYNQLIILKKDIINKNNHPYINKILSKYNIPSIGKKINTILDEVVIKNIDITIEFINKFIQIYQKSLKILLENNLSKEETMKIYFDIYLKINELKDNITFIFLTLTDLYFLRRFLDKDYIKTAIIYTGAHHMRDISYLLVKYFNYKITDTYFVRKDFNIKDITKFKTDNFHYIKELTKFTNKTDENLIITQCMNMFNFPTNFT
jgi:hypothetical protein